FSSRRRHTISDRDWSSDVCSSDLLQKPESHALMAAWKNQPYMLGIRMAFNAGRTRQWLEDGTADWFWDAAERYGVPVMAFAPSAVPKLGDIAERHPGLRMIIDHMGLNSALRGKSLEPSVANT